MTYGARVSRHIRFKTCAHLVWDGWWVGCSRGLTVHALPFSEQWAIAKNRDNYGSQIIVMRLFVALLWYVL